MPSRHSLFTPRGDIFSQQEEEQVLGILHSYRKGKKKSGKVLNSKKKKKKLQREIKSPTRKQPLIRSYRFFSLEYVACRWGSTFLVLRIFPTSFQQGLHSFSSARKSLHFGKREANSQESANHCSRPSKPHSVASGLEIESFRSQPSAAHIPWKFSIRDKAESILFLALSEFLKYFANHLLHLYLSPVKWALALGTPHLKAWFTHSLTLLEIPVPHSFRTLFCLKTFHFPFISRPSAKACMDIKFTSK